MRRPHAACLRTSFVSTCSQEGQTKCEAEITHLNVVLRLLCVREQACGERAHLRQGCDLIGQLMHRDIVVLGARHQEYVLCQPGREASCLVFLIVLHHLIRRVEPGVVHALLHSPVQEQALGHSVGEECVNRVLVAGVDPVKESPARWRRHGAQEALERVGAIGVPVV